MVKYHSVEQSKNGGLQIFDDLPPAEDIVMISTFQSQVAFQIGALSASGYPGIGICLTGWKLTRVFCFLPLLVFHFCSCSTQSIRTQEARRAVDRWLHACLCCFVSLLLTFTLLQTVSAVCLGRDLV